LLSGAKPRIFSSFRGKKEQSQMKKHVLLTVALISFSSVGYAADLIQVYQEALLSDPIYQQAVAQRLSDNETSPIARSALLPQAAINGGPSLTKFNQGAVQGFPPYNATSKGYAFTLGLSQTVFNYAQFKALSEANAIGRSADATLNAAEQSLMVRVAQAYFAVLKDEENLIYSRSNQNAYAKQYDQINQQYKVGLKTITDVYTAKASYDTASANYIAAQTTLLNDKENLRAITGRLYPSLATLSEKFPLITPQPANMEAWVDTAKLQNWSIKAAQYSSQAARENVKQQYGGHLPTVSLQGAYSVSYNNNFASTTSTNTVDSGGNVDDTSTTVSQVASYLPPAQTHTKNATVTLNLGVPIFQGGGVVAQTNQARYGYQIANQKLEQAVRQTINTTRKSYLGIIAGIQQIKADRQAIKSSVSSLDGLRAGYRVGTQTLVDVLNQQQRMFLTQTQYATDRYAYVNNLLTLKQAAGTLSAEDLQAINAWLINRDEVDDDVVMERVEVQRPAREKTTPYKTAAAKLPKKITLAKAGIVDYTLTP
jgi:outer membrane protein